MICGGLLTSLELIVLSTLRRCFACDHRRLPRKVSWTVINPWQRPLRDQANGALLEFWRNGPRAERTSARRFTGCTRVEPLAAALRKTTTLTLRQLLEPISPGDLHNLNFWRWDWDLEAVLQLPYADEILGFWRKS